MITDLLLRTIVDPEQAAQAPMVRSGINLNITNKSCTDFVGIELIWTYYNIKQFKPEEPSSEYTIGVLQYCTTKCVIIFELYFIICSNHEKCSNNWVKFVKDNQSYFIEVAVPYRTVLIFRFVVLENSYLSLRNM